MRKFISVALILTMPAVAQAGAFDILDNSLKAGVQSVTNALQMTATLWLSSFVLIQMIITNIGLLKSGADIDAIYGKLIGSLIWFGFCFYVLKNGADFIESVSKGFFDTAANISGVGGFNPGLIIDQGATLAANLIGKINDVTSITSGFLPALIGGLLGVTILATAALIAFKIFLIKIEMMLIIMIAPMSFSLMGLNALKDQGIAPFKSLLSLIYRVLILAVLMKAMGSMTDNLTAVIGQINDDSIDGIWSVVFAATLGYVLFGFLVFKSDSIAASLSSGSTNLGTGDVASAAAMGAAAGAAIGAGGASVGGAAAKIPQSMSGFMSNLTGGGSLLNASSRGGGAMSPPSSSLSEPSGAPKFETNKAGAPIRPSATPSSPMQSLLGAENESALPIGATSGDSGVSSSSEQKTSSEAAAPKFDTNKPDAPKQKQAAGSGASAGIDGAGTATDQKIDDLMNQMAKQNAPQGSSFGENIASLNQHIAQEKASTGISVNVNAAD